MIEPRVAIITGASSGIGRALAERAVRAGWSVYAVGRRAERLAELSRAVESATGELATLVCDLRERGSAERIVRETLARFGRLDVLVNNAGGVAVGAISRQSDDALYEQVETHVVAPLALTREALPALQKSRGQIVYFGSGVARIPVATLGAYPPAKAAVRSMSRIARNELRPLGIAVTYVDPGAVATEFMTRAGFEGPPPAIAALPANVAQRVFESFATRRPVVNAVPWQTFFVALGEALPQITDYLLSRAPDIVGGKADDLTEMPAPKPALVPPPRPSSFDSAGDAGSAQDDKTDAPATTSPVIRSGAPERRAVEGRPATAAAEPATPFEAALAPQLARMAKFKLTPAFLASILEPGAQLELGDVAMRWAGMPNKHERALTNDVLDALAEAGYLQHLEPERYAVVRSAGDEAFGM